MNQKPFQTQEIQSLLKQVEFNVADNYTALGGVYTESQNGAIRIKPYPVHQLGLSVTDDKSELFYVALDIFPFNGEKSSVSNIDLELVQINRTFSATTNQRGQTWFKNIPKGENYRIQVTQLPDSVAITTLATNLKAKWQEFSRLRMINCLDIPLLTRLGFASAATKKPLVEQQSHQLPKKYENKDNDSILRFFHKRDDWVVSFASKHELANKSLGLVIIDHSENERVNEILELVYDDERWRFRYVLPQSIRRSQVKRIQVYELE